MRHQEGSVCRHLDGAKLSNVCKPRTELKRSVLWWVVAQDASKNHESELRMVCRLEHGCGTHVHEADIV
jgi:hypothetical protein